MPSRLCLSLFFCLVLLIYNGSSIQAEHHYYAGILPELQLNYELSEKVELRKTIANRHLFFSGNFTEKPTLKYNFSLADFIFIGQYKFDDRHRIGVGYLFRLSNENFHHRTIQYYTYAFSKFNNRIRTEQQFGNVSHIWWLRVRNRLRYQTSLNEERQIRLLVSTELLTAFHEERVSMETRALIALRFAFKNSYRLTAGPEHRFSNLLDNTQKHVFWLYLSFQIRI